MKGGESKAIHYINYLIKFVLFFLSNLGYWELLYKKTKINSYFLPSLTVAVQVSILYFAGLFNILYEASILIWISGIFGLIWNHIHGQRVYSHYKNIGYIYLVCLLILLVFYLRGKTFVHYDNFSHWAIVVKRMHDTNRYPNFEDTIIMFKEYPLGSAAYIFYVATVIGRSEAIQMFAQAYMIVVCFLPIFIFCKKIRSFHVFLWFLQ